MKYLEIDPNKFFVNKLELKINKGTTALLTQY